MPYILFADTNVILDDILNRMPAAPECKEIFELAEKGEIIIYTSSACLPTIIYLLRKSGMANSIIIQICDSLLNVYKLSSPNKNDIIAGLYAGFNDLEDALLYYTALTIKGITHFVTSNVKDFKNVSTRLPVASPSQFLRDYKKSKTI